MNKKTIYKILYSYCKIRETENRIAKEYKLQKIRCPIHLSIGQESISAAMSAIYDKNDYVISNHRCHAHYISKNSSSYKMIAELYGLKDGCSKGNGGSMHLVDEEKNFIGSTAIVANSIPVGVGYAYGLFLKNIKSRVFIFFGEAATESGVLYESINFAIIKKLNITFICENNLYSVYSGLEDRQPKNRKIFKMISSMGIKSCKIFSNNPFTIYKKINNFVKNNSTSFIEIDTYRYIEHCGPNIDDDLNYRPKKEVNYWLSKDFYKLLFKNTLVKKNFNQNDLLNIKKKILTEIDEVFLKVNNSRRLKNFS